MNDTELENGLKLTLKNAQQLIEEADGLVVFERYSRAFTLYQLGTEEIGKCIILFKAIIDYYNEFTIDLDYLRENGFFDHKEKTKESLKVELLVIESFEKHIGSETGFKQKIIEDFNNTSQINDNKNNSLYVSINDDIFKSPDDLITKEMVNELWLLSKIRLEGIKPFIRTLTEMKEIAKVAKELLDLKDKKDEKIDLTQQDGQIKHV